jgi:hypothetical protein
MSAQKPIEPKKEGMITSFVKNSLSSIGGFLKGTVYGGVAAIGAATLGAAKIVATPVRVGLGVVGAGLSAGVGVATVLATVPLEKNSNPALITLQIR